LPEVAVQSQGGIGNQGIVEHKGNGGEEIYRPKARAARGRKSKEKHGNRRAAIRATAWFPRHPSRFRGGPVEKRVRTKREKKKKKTKTPSQKIYAHHRRLLIGGGGEGNLTCLKG